MTKTDTFETFLTSQSILVDPINFTINLLLAAFLAYILSHVYRVYGNSLSNRRSFSRNLILLAMITMTVISIVKSSLALSLGLVGALSIVRFRAAIKEPEELTYLFLAISIGLGLGADQRFIIIISLFITVIVIIGLKKMTRDEMITQSNMFITISSHKKEKIKLDTIINIVNDSCAMVDLRRMDQDENMIEVTFNTVINSTENLDELTKKLSEIDSEIKITYIDQQGIPI